MINYTWTINQLDCIPNVDSMSDYVVQSYYSVSGTDGTYSGTLTGTATFVVDPTQATYVPYADITEIEAIAWTQASLGDQVASIEDCINDQIQKQITPPVVTQPLPWSV
jgi:hypothetical protein